MAKVCRLFSLGGVFFIWCAFILVIESSSFNVRILLKGSQCNGSNILETREFPPVVPAADLPLTNLFASYDFICSILAQQRQAVASTFEDNVCTLLAVGEADSCKSSTYRSMPFVPFETLEEVAQGKDTNTSYPHNSYYLGGMALDGNIDTLSVSALSVLHSWWMVDLGEIRTVHQIQILPGQRDCCYDRTFDIEVRIGSSLLTTGDFTSYTKMFFYAGPYSADQGNLILSDAQGFPGRFVSLQMMSDNPLTNMELAEVKVFAKKL